VVTSPGHQTCGQSRIAPSNVKCGMGPTCTPVSLRYVNGPHTYTCQLEVCRLIFKACSNHSFAHHPPFRCLISPCVHAHLVLCSFSLGCNWPPSSWMAVTKAWLQANTQCFTKTHIALELQ
jgi:hypothetical protein